MGRLACPVLSDKLAAPRQFACLPTCPQYSRVTPTEWLFRQSGAVDDPSHNRSLLLHRGQSVLAHCFQKLFVTPGRRGYDMVQGLWVWRRLPGHRRAAIGSTLLRSPGSSKPCTRTSEEPPDPSAPRLTPANPDRPRSVFVGRLAQQSWRSRPAT
jgi:hypothetical protein